MKIQVDKFGRILLPKSIRDHYGLKPGTVLAIEEGKQTIILKLVAKTAPIVFKQGIAVYQGEAIGDLEDAVKKNRDERDEDLKGF